MRPTLILALLAPLLGSGCCRPCCQRPACSFPVQPVPSAPIDDPAARTRGYFSDDEDADRDPARPENLYPGAGETLVVHDVRDLEARPGFDRETARRALRAAVPSAVFQWREGRIVSVGPDVAQFAVFAWLLGARAAAAPEPPGIGIRYFDIRDLGLPPAPEVKLAPASTTFEPWDAPLPVIPPDPAWLCELRAVVPTAEIDLKSHVLVVRGPEDALDEVGRRIEARRAHRASPR